MRTFHVGGTATKISEENRIVLKYPVIVKSIYGTHVELPEGWLFTRKGSMIVNRIIKEIKLTSSDKLLVADGDRVAKDSDLYEHKGKIVKAEVIAFVAIRDNTIYLTSNEQKLEIKNGSKMEVVAGDIGKPVNN